MSKKTTKRALWMSVLSLFLCFSMLVGTTFAWFTDEVESGLNQIVAGNLDVELYHANTKDEYAEVTSETKLFDEVDPKLWEPGAVAFENLTVTNEGTLALKYQLSIIFENATVVNGHSLAEALQVGVVEGGIQGTTRDAVLAEVKAWQPLATFTLSGELEAGDKATYGIVIWWEPTENDNWFNMNNGNQGKILSIDLGVRLFATQLMSEEDSFGKDYDDGAYLPIVYTEAELKSALENNESVQLGGNIALTETWTPIGDKDAGVYYTGTLEGNGYTISGLNVTANDYDALISAAKDATIKNLTVEGVVNGVNAAGIVARVEGNTVIENCVSNVTVTGTTKAGGIVCNVTNSGKTVIANCVNNGNVNGGDSGIGGIVGYVNNDAYLEIINCANNGNVTSDNNKYAGAAVGYGAKSKGVVVGFTNTGVITGTLASDNRFLKDGDTVLVGYVNTSGNWIAAKAINNAADLLALGGKSVEGTYMLTADINLVGAAMPTIGAAYGKSLTIVGNGYTISNATTAHTTHNGMKHHGFFYAYTNSTLTISNLTFENIEIDATKDTVRNFGVGIVVAYADGGSTVNLTNVDVKNCKVLNNIPDIGDEAGVYVGYQTGTLNMVDCDSTGCSVAGETAEKTGAFIGMVNGTATLTNCTTDLAIGPCNRIGGTLIVDGAEYVIVKGQTGLNEALTNGETDIVLGAGNYTMPEPDLRGKTLTIKGTKDTVIDVSAVDARDQFVTGATIVFDGVTLNFGKANYMGFANTASLTYKDCTINGLQFLYGANVTFENCVLNSNGAEHCVWTYGAQNVSFIGCDFTYGDRGINCYSDNDVTGGKQTVNFTNCTFTTENTESKGAVEINSYFFSVGIEVNMTGCTAPAYGKMAYVSEWDSTNGAKTTINIQ